MDHKKFGDRSPGKLVPSWGEDWAFVPESLPPKWEFPVSLWPLLAEAREKLALLEGVGRTLPNPSLLLKPLGRREAIQSSRIEGTYASPKELLLFEMEPREPKAGEDRVSDWQEVWNHQAALDYAIASELPLSLRLIREVHSILMRGVRGKDKAPGEFRRVPVAIGDGRRFIPPPADQLKTCLDSLERYFHAPARQDPLVECFLTHYQFETIHPFMDGNGRVGRLLLVIMIQQRCHLTKPWLYLSDYFEQRRDEYCQRLFEVSAQGAWTEWVEFCLRGTILQAAATVSRCDKLRAIREDYMRRLTDVGGSVRLNNIVEGLFNSPFVRITDIAAKLRVTYPTAKADVERLIQAKILRGVPNVPQKTFYAEEVYKVAYGDMDQNRGKS